MSRSSWVIWVGPKFNDKCLDKKYTGFMSQSVQAAITEYIDEVEYKQQEFISYDSGGWKSEIGVPGWSIFKMQTAKFLYPHMAKYESASFPALSQKNTNLIHERSTLMT